MVLIGGERWKEVKLTAVSEVEVRAAEERAVGESQPSRCAGLTGGIEPPQLSGGPVGRCPMTLHQYTEGLRRGVDRCQQLSSVNDGAPWIERMTYTNFPEAVQV
jgi:hypothetical protein